MNRLCMRVPDIVGKHLPQPELARRHRALAPITPMGTISDPKDIAEAVVYLAEAGHVTGEVLHVDDGAHVDRW
jgi:NAD(P)-dependent dehydrogenase (short-subunit alcohol dehydrogenase family)